MSTPRSIVSKNKTPIAIAAALVSAAAVVTQVYRKSIAKAAAMSLPLHPSLNNGITKGSASFSGGKLRCNAGSLRVPSFSVIGVIPKDQVSVTANADKLYIVDESAAIQRHACSSCGVHMYGRIEKEHPFKGLDFVHTELSSEKGWQEPQFAAFVSSIIEQGFDASKMDAVRAQFKSIGLETYDALSPPLMDAIASWTAQKAKI
ncbi:putative glutathione-dependent formaldehyde-activating enzyme [Fusarium oligoseptatum]|uniref:Putative glutathione-dependent formaldehyde-activating enzyme n=1 Tax=Fusarium oligoseptatum TaxID=2604345 RepID=A0A428SZ56_9HYPO|nr:putative glutathione-dependent formaldehyde-activating enzyme [Fusarium oligoseptatum]